MDLSIEERWEKAIRFFKEKFGLNLNNYSPEQQKIIINQMNEQLKKSIQEETKKRDKLYTEILIESNRVIELSEQLGE